jgi:hypothetical protein
MDLHKDIVTIDSTLSKKELLNIDVLAQKHPRVLLLYAPYVTGELVINQDKLEDIISMEDDNNRINKISTSRKFIDILKLFKTVGAYSGKKMFLIDQCKDNKDVIISNPKDDIVRAYFKDEKGNKEMADFYDKRNNQEIKFQPIGHYAQDYENKLKLLQNHVYKV